MKVVYAQSHVLPGSVIWRKAIELRSYSLEKF